MKKIQCTKCGAKNTLVVDASKVTGASFNLNCGTCGHILLTLQSDNKSNNDSKNGFTERKFNAPDISFLTAMLKRKAWMFKFLIFVTFAFYCLSTLDLLDVMKGDPTVSITQTLASSTTKAVPVNHARSAFYSYSIDQRKLIQLSLKNFYNYHGKLDGLWGPGTQSAYNRLRKTEPQNVKGLSHSEVYANMINNISRQAGNVYRRSNNDFGNYFINQLIGQSPLFRPRQPPQPTTQTKNKIGSQYTNTGWWRDRRGNTMCSYSDGSTINIGGGMCPYNRP